MVFIEALKYPFKGQSIVSKLLFLLLLPLLPVIGSLLLMGYGVRIIFQTIASEEGYGDVRGLPEWDDWTGDALRGLVSMLANSLLALVMMVIMVLFITALAFLADIVVE